MASINATVLATLLSHTAQNTPPSLRPWIMPPTFGESNGYTTLARLADAGITAEALDACGLAIQGETLTRYRTTMDYSGKVALPDAKGRRDRYTAAGHSRPVAWQADKWSPSGLRPASVPSGVSAGNFATWYAALLSASANATGTTVEIPALVSGDGSSVAGSNGTTPTTVRAPRSSGPFARFTGLRTLLSAACADVLSAMANADNADSIVGPRDTFAAWISTCPIAELDKVSADTFDTTTIRVGSRVTFADGAASGKVTAFRVKASGGIMPEYWTIASIADGFAVISAGGSTGPMPVKLSDLRRYHAPVAITPATPKAFVPVVDGFAMYDGGEVLILAFPVAGTATVLGADGAETDVAVEFLSAA